MGDGKVIRKPYVAGQFYEAAPSSLKSQVDRYMIRDAQRQDAIAIMAPHAGFVYSGSVAGAVYSSITVPDVFVLLGPNHTGLGLAAAVYPGGKWETPIGSLEVEGGLVEAILSRCKHCKKDSTAHEFEHSLEVHLPFIVSIADKAGIVPIAIMRASVAECAEIGLAIAEAISSYGKRVVIAASTDMSHYVSDETARRLDAMAIDRMLQRDPEGLYEVVAKNRISMCGVLPVTTALFAANALGATTASLVKYTTSAEASGNYNHVVGYAGIVVR